MGPHPKPTPSQKELLASVYGSVCLRCGAEFPLEDLTKDHIIPADKGGHNHIGNYQLMCKPCNEDKDNTIHDYRPDQGAAFPKPPEPDPRNARRARKARAKAKTITLEQGIKNFERREKKKKQPSYGPNSGAAHHVIESQKQLYYVHDPVEAQKHLDSLFPKDRESIVVINDHPYRVITRDDERWANNQSPSLRGPEPPNNDHC